MSKIIWITVFALLLLAQDAKALSCLNSNQSPSQQIAQYLNRADLVAKVRVSEMYASFDVLRVWKGEPYARVLANGYLPDTGEFVLFAVNKSGQYRSIGACLAVANPEELLNLEYGPGIPPSDNVIPYLGVLLSLSFLALFGMGLVMWSATHNKAMKFASAFGLRPTGLKAGGLS